MINPILDEVFTYSPNNDLVGIELPREGLNNQRIALYGLMAYCMENQRSALFPKYCIDHVPKPFFDVQSPLDYLAYSMRLFYYYARAKAFRPRVPFSNVFAPHFFNYQFSFHQVSETLSFKDALCLGFNRLPLVVDREEYKRIFISIGFSQYVLDLSAELIGKLNNLCTGSFNCVSLRLEKDWLHYINSQRFAGEPSEVALFTEKNFLNQMLSLSRITGVYSFYCCTDLRDLSIPFDRFKYKAAKRGISLYNKRDLGLSIQSSRSSLVSASIDYLIALKSFAYLGSTRSTFSNLLYLDNHLSTNTSHYDYVMNLSLDHPVLRSSLIV